MARLLDAGAPVGGLYVAPYCVRKRTTTDLSMRGGPARGPDGKGSKSRTPLQERPGSQVSAAGSLGRGSSMDSSNPRSSEHFETEPPELPAAGWAPLHLLLARGQLDALKQIIAWGADPARPGGPENLTPLMLATQLGHEALALYLLELPEVLERVDDQDNRGRCALHFAVSARSEAVVRGLLEANASPSLRSYGGLTPLDVARHANIPESSAVVKRLQVEEIVKLVMHRCRCRALNKYEESELVRGDLRLRGVALDVQKERWSLPDGTWGYLSMDYDKAQVQGGPSVMADAL
eukprot:TRINITY_DN19429_c0_g1_i2.p1 TRINITY_DN19429_c0_g1~~TRINITY_DN19429_c0_g1_i2.p1  ORF type:complete len:293 (-),score=56.78 TRINITY_DN19429_c0_g1_i2:62-940(-)